MIFYLVRRYIAMPVGLAFSIGASILFAALPDFAVAIAMPGLVAIFRAIPQRPTRFEAALPISGRNLIIARVASTLILVLVPLIVWMLASLAYGHGWSITVQLEIVAIVILAVVVPYTIAPDQLAPRVLVVLAPWLGLAVFAAITMYALTPPSGLVVFALALVGAVWLAWSGMPESFQVSPLDTGREGATARPRSAHFASIWWMPMLRSALAPMTMLFCLLVLVDAMLGNWLVMFVIGLRMGYDPIRQRMLWMLALPLSHRMRLLLVLTPGVFTYLACVGIGQRIGDPFLEAHNKMTFGAPSPRYRAGQYFESESNVSLEYWHRAPSGQLPVIAAPWGESTPLDTMTVFGMLLYNPYSTGEHSSDRFVEWQFERATTAVYGHSISRVDYKRHVPPPTMTDSWRVYTLSAAALITFVFLSVLMIELGLRFERARPYSGSFLMALALGSSSLPFVFVELYYEIRRTGHYIVPMVESFLMHVSRVLPSSFAVVLVVGAIPVLVSYALLERQFGRTELAKVKLPWK